ncbi:hypothetical protein [Roseinatronobacter monicus]|uniref:hypothetical protein n=1 Tax=Roseinatronobacter monicus TaxID=393481 RepID=UPI001151401F|nr:hypothetical protein [Roseinatronobacter monicus]
MAETAFHQFQSTYIKQLEDGRQDQRAAEKTRMKAIKRLEKEKDNLLTAVRSGKAHDILLEDLERVAAELDRKKAEHEAKQIGPPELPRDLRKKYEEMIQRIVDTLQDEGVAGRAAEVLQEMIERIDVTYEKNRKGHTLHIQGRLVKMLANADPANAEGYEREKVRLSWLRGQDLNL